MCNSEKQAIYLLTEKDVEAVEQLLAQAAMALDNIILRRCIPPSVDPDDIQHSALFAVADALLSECFDNASESCF